MPIVEEPRFEGFIARVLELTSTHTPWHRRLWRSGTLQLARELLDECTNPDLPDTALKDMKSHLEHALGTDPGIGDRGKALKPALRGIQQGVTEGSHSWLALRAHLERMSAGYLSNWAAEFESDKLVEIEGTARRITAHILGEGYHKSSLYTWITALKRDPGIITVPEFLRQAEDRLSKSEREYTFCIPISTTPPFDIGEGVSPGWMDSSETSNWKSTYAPNAESVRHQGSFLLAVKARDINTAADRARAHLFDLQTKFELGAKRPIRICPRMWSKDKGGTYPTRGTDRIVEIQSFELHDGIRSLETPDFIVSALTLVQPLRTSPPHLAVMSGWSAIESLLIGVGDQPDVLAAERFGRIVAASMIRAELTTLAWKYCKEHEDETATAITRCVDNADRARKFQMRACESSPVRFSADVDNLALSRIRPALGDPRGEVEKIQKILTREFIRLYRKRNLIAHAGRTQDTTLHATTETVSPLIGAGIDRIVYVGLKYHLNPIQMSALVEAKIPYLVPASTTNPGNLVDIFEFT